MPEFASSRDKNEEKTEKVLKLKRLSLDDLAPADIASNAVLLSAEDDEEEEEEEEDEDLPSFKSVVFKSPRKQQPTADDQSMFYDSQSNVWVKVDNFAFAERTNHFNNESSIISETTSSSSFALLDSKCLEDDLDNTTMADFEKQFAAAVKNNQKTKKPILHSPASSQPTSLDTTISDDSCHSKPKIRSPRDIANVKSGGKLRKISDEMATALPSRSNPPTPREAAVEHKTSSKIPRYVRNAASTTNRGCPVERRVKQSQWDRSAKRLGHNRSHSASNLSRLSVRDYHGQRRDSHSSGVDIEPVTLMKRVRSSSCDSLSRLARQELAGHKADYSHVQSKVKAYIEGVNHIRRPSRKHDDPYGKSFVLSPGRKSLSMSNIYADDNNQNSSQLSSNCSSNLSRMKAFLSAKNLDDVQVTVRQQRSMSKSQDSLLSGVESAVDMSKISRLLNNLSDDDNDNHCTSPSFGGTTGDGQENGLVFGVGDLLQLAMVERKGKQEAKQVLAQLQANYDNLQQRYAEAETTIDKLRFGTPEPTGDNVDSAFTDVPTSQQVSFQPDNNSTMLLSSIRPVEVDQTVFQPRDENLIVNPPLETSSASPTLVLAKQKLTDIQEELYGLELLSSTASSWTSVEKQKTLSRLRLSYDKVHCETNTFFTHMASKNVAGGDAAVTDHDLVQLIKSVGKKLYLMELKQSSSKDDDSLDVLPPSTAANKESDMGPIEKVAKWQLDGGKALKPSSNVPSGYGSYSTSPTAVKNKSERSSFDHWSGGDLDSGCPGSDRSGGRQGGHALSSIKVHLLANVEEKEEKSQASPHSEKDKDLAVPLQHCLHSVTDLSSDEQQSSPISSSPVRPQDIDKEIDRLRVQASTPNNNEQHSPNSTLTDLVLPTPPNSAPRGCTMVLAEQIDQEINELRNFFDDHREEMLSLLNENKNSTTIRNVSLPANIMEQKSTIAAKSPRSLARLRQRSYNRPTLLSEEDSDSAAVQEERRLEFERRRQRKQRLHASQFKQQKSNSEMMEEPSFAIGAPASERSGGAISAFFPHVDGGGGRHVDTVDGEQVFIPRLSLDDGWSDTQQNGPQDSRSFDFNQSLDEQRVVEEKSCQVVEPVGHCDRACQTPVMEQHGGGGYFSDVATMTEKPLENMKRSVSVGQMSRQSSASSSQNPVVIVKGCCLHDADKKKKKKRKSDKTSRQKKQDLKDLLQSLTVANEMAIKMKQRSESILNAIGQEMTSLQGAVAQEY